MQELENSAFEMPRRRRKLRLVSGVRTPCTYDAYPQVEVVVGAIVHDRTARLLPAVLPRVAV